MPSLKTVFSCLLKGKGEADIPLSGAGSINMGLLLKRFSFMCPPDKLLWLMGQSREPLPVI